MMLTQNQRHQLERLAHHVDQVTQTDRVFFEQHPDRQHRIRFSSEPEIACHEIIENKLLQPPAGRRWYTIVRNVLPGARVRIFVAYHDDAETGLDVTEDHARAAFDTFANAGAREMEAAIRAARGIGQ